MKRCPKCLKKCETDKRRKEKCVSYLIDHPTCSTDYRMEYCPTKKCGYKVFYKFVLEDETNKLIDKMSKNVP